MVFQHEHESIYTPLSQIAGGLKDRGGLNHRSLTSND